MPSSQSGHESQAPPINLLVVVYRCWRNGGTEEWLPLSRDDDDIHSRESVMFTSPPYQVIHFYCHDGLASTVSMSRHSIFEDVFHQQLWALRRLEDVLVKVTHDARLPRTTRQRGVQIKKAQFAWQRSAGPP